MFETYLQSQSTNGPSRSRLIAAGMASLTLTLGALSVMWLNDKLQVAQVEAPKVNYVVAMMVHEPAVEVKPPPPPPALRTKKREGSKRKGSARAKPNENPTPTVEPNPNLTDIGDTAVSSFTGSAPTTAVLTGATSGSFAELRSHGDGDEGVEGLSVIQPVSLVRANEIYTPDPDPMKLATTQTAKRDRRSGSSKVFFCVTTDGRTADIRTTGKFLSGHDPQVDHICRNAVKKWRFKPFRVAGRPVKVCTSMSFNLRFD